MATPRSSFDTEKAAKYLLLFQQGRRGGLDYVYRNSFADLVFFGKQLLNDEFTVSTLLHECYLKAWHHRGRMESLWHIYRFIRMNLRWQILRHIEKSRHSIYGQMLCLDQFENTIGNSEDLLEDSECRQEDAQKLEALAQTIQYLAPQARQIILLYFQKGLTQREIADRLGKTTSQICSQIEKSVKQIKIMVHCTQKKTELHDAVSPAGPHMLLLNSEQSKIYELRKNQKLTFDAIAIKLGLSTPEVQKRYIQVHQLLQNQSAQKITNRF